MEALIARVGANSSPTRHLALVDEAPRALGAIHPCRSSLPVSPYPLAISTRFQFSHGRRLRIKLHKQSPRT
jgi:hypothetical protein